MPTVRSVVFIIGVWLLMSRTYAFNYDCSSFLRTITRDVVDIHKYIFSTDSLIVLAACAPVYGITRSYDCNIHSYFYDYKKHRNIRQLPSWCPYFASKVPTVPFLVTAGLALGAADYELRTTAQVFWTGLPCCGIAKKLLKKIPFCGSIRPYSQYFKRKKVFGGFPSGHVATVAYMTTLFGKRFGASWGIPLGLLSSFIAAEFTICNRHFASQVVAGAALGIIYGLASDKLVTQKIASSFSWHITADSRTTAFSCTYAF